MTLREVAVKYAWVLLKDPYIWGGESFDGRDCSGQAQEILRAVGQDPIGDQTAQALYECFKSEIVDYLHNGIREGCLVFFGKDSKHITHVGFSIGNGLMIEQGGGGSKTLTRGDATKQKAFSRIRPISNRSDFVCAVDPFKFI